MWRDDAGFHLRLLDSLPVGIVVWHLEDARDDWSLRLIYANAAASAATGVDLRESMAGRISAIFPAVAEERVHVYADVCRQETTRDLGTIAHRDDRGGAHSLTVTAIPAPPRSVALVFQEVSEISRMEAEARGLNRFLDSLVEHIPAMVFVKDAKDLRFQRFNRAGEELLGLPRSQLLGKNDYDFFPVEQADHFVAKDREVLRSRALVDIPEEPIETPRGRRWLHTRKIAIVGDDGTPQHLLGVSIDITERREAEILIREHRAALERDVAERTSDLQREIGAHQRTGAALARAEDQMRQMQKMEAIGRLAGGIAHDFNNLLSIIISYSGFALEQLDPAHPLWADLDEVRNAGARAAELTRQLLAFSRQQVLQPRLIDLSDVLRGMQRMLPRLLGADVDLTIRLASDGDRVIADPGQIEQVIMNLAVNARDAMPRGGKLTIETSRVELDETYAAEHLGARAGPHAMLAVSDTGTGIEPATMDHIFEPFFTTKELGKGTGLGLSTVFGIVKQSGGSIWVYSEPGAGATFKVYLPIADAGTMDRSRPIPIVRDLHGSETILLVEDSDPVRTLASTILRRYGHRVLEARGPAEALALAAGYDQRIDLLLTDVVMPVVSGSVLAERLRTTRPDIQVLFMSGYTDDAVVRHGVLESGAAFLQKPLTPDTLMRRVREVLDGAARDGSAP